MQSVYFHTGIGTTKVWRDSVPNLGAAVFCGTIRFAAVNDNTGTINIWTLPYTREH